MFLQYIYFALYGKVKQSGSSNAYPFEVKQSSSSKAK
jgi:hypothetical protein